MATQTWEPDGPARGRIVLVHGLSSLAQTWWQVGPALAARGWQVTAVDQAGHGGRRLDRPTTLDTLVDSVLGDVPEPPDLVLGHSLGSLTVLALIDRHPGWAPRVVLEDPPIPDPAYAEEFARSVADSLALAASEVARDRSAAVAQVRRDCPLWRDEDVEWAVEGIARMDADGFATWLAGTVDDPELREVRARLVGIDPTPYVLAARSEKSFLHGGSALSDASREHLRRTLPEGHVIDVVGGHCLHRDAPESWLEALETILP